MEEAVLFGTASALVGVITHPATADGEHRTKAVILLNAGLLHRVGPHRLYVELARRLGALGFTTLRFDFSGIGDSDVRRDSLPFDTSILGEVKEAMDVLGRRRGIDRFVLMGLCGGAVSAFKAARANARVDGIVLINPQDYDEDVASFADARRYWRNVLRVLIRPSRWLATIPRYARVRTMLEQLGRLLSPPPAARDLREELCGLVERGVKMLVLFSSARQRGVAELEAILGGRLAALQASRRVRVHTIGAATHTFDELCHQTQLLDTIAAWMHESFSEAGRPRMR